MVSLVHADSWIQKADFGGTGRLSPMYFSLNGKGYIGAGMDSYPVANYRNDFWQYDPITDSWTQMADFGGVPRYTMMAFATGGFGYAGTGKEHSASNLFNDIWRYDPLSNVWTQMNNFPGAGRQSPFVININDKVYVGMGRTSVTFLDDWYLYNDTMDTWIPKTSFPGTARGSGFAFSIDNKGYIGTGMITYQP